MKLVRVKNHKSGEYIFVDEKTGEVYAGDGSIYEVNPSKKQYGAIDGTIP